MQLQSSFAGFLRCPIPIVGLFLLWPCFVRGTEPAALPLESPLPWQVIQREGYDPRETHPHAVGGPKLGSGRIRIAGKFPAGKLQVRVLKADTTPETVVRDWSEPETVAGERHVTVPAGGWYQVDVRVLEGDSAVAQGSVKPVGIGEVFVIAGQSYAAGANDEHLRVDEPVQVARYDPVKKIWEPAHDPQPNVDTGGTIWPAFANALQPIVQVPVGLVNVASGGTASRQWMPGSTLYENLERAGTTLGRFRAVLWQQGESDVIENIDTQTYVKRLVLIRTSLAKTWGLEPPWLLAKSTMHPTVYNEPAKEHQIRAAIDALWERPGFRPGPDTDLLAGENRGGIGSRRHFTGIGQRRAGMMWFAAVWNEMQRRAP